MRKLLGLILAVAGALFARAAYENAPTHREDQLAAVTRILTNPGVMAAPLPSSVVTPAAPTPVDSRAAAPVKTALSVPASPARPVETVERGAVATTTTAWQTPVAADTPRPGTTAAISSPVPANSSARYELVRAIQGELKRLGCYSGDVHGTWSASSKRALLSFMDRVNASLPAEQPDYIQLTLLQNQGAAVCGRDCPKGQAQGDGGRCVPNAILARAELKKTGDESATGWAAQTTVAAPTDSEDRRPESGSQNRQPVAPEQLPWASQLIVTAPARPNNDHATVAAVEPIRRPVPAGRMSVGGPLPPTIDQGPATLPAGAGSQRLARLDEPLNPREEPDDQASDATNDGTDDGVEKVFTVDPASPNRAQTARPSTRRIEAPAAAPNSFVAPHIVAQPRVRAAVPRYYAPRPQRVAARPQRQRVSPFRQRSVQSLFTHPLGRL